MASYITYKSVIANAIADFNSIQNALATKSTTIATTADSSSDSKLVPSAELPGKIRDYLVFPNGSLTITGAGTFSVATDIASGTNRTGYASVIVPAATTTVDGNVVSVSSAGWIGTGNVGTISTGALKDISVAENSSTGGLTITAGVATAGYLTTSATKTYNLAKATWTGGSLSGAQTVNPGTMTISKIAEASQDSNVVFDGVEIGAKDTDNWPYYFKINANTAAASGSFSFGALSIATAGYLAKGTTLKSGVTNSITVPAKSADTYVKLKAASRSASVINYTAPKVSVSTSTSGISTSSSDTGYSVTVIASPTNGAVGARATTTAGYITAGTSDTPSNTTITPSVSGSGSKVFIKAGSITHSLDLTATLTDTDDGYVGSSSSSGTAVNLFVDTVPTSGDYYTIKANNSCSFTEGYIKSNPGGATKYKYIPKAVLEYVTDTSDGTNFIQVKTGGYLPAGVLGDIASFSGSPDYASLGGITYSGPTKNSTTGKYDIVGTLKINSAGYLKSGATTSGTLSLAEATHTLDVSSTGNATAKVTGAATGFTASSAETSYYVTVNGSQTGAGGAKATVTTGAGYCPGGDGPTGTASVGVTITGSGTKVYIPTTSASSTAGHATITEVTSRTAVSGNDYGNALNTSTAPNQAYVKITATGYGTATYSSTGMVGSGTTVTTSSGSDTNYIKASNPSVTGLSSTVSVGTISVGGTSQFNTSTGAVTAGSKTNSSGTKSASISGSSSSYKDTYVLGNVTASGTAYASATANINSDATGSNVDTYVEALYKRLLGVAYTAVSGD